MRRATVYRATACLQCGGHRFGVGRGDDPRCSNECTFDHWAETGQYPRFVGQGAAPELAKTARTPAKAKVAA